MDEWTFDAKLIVSSFLEIIFLTEIDLSSFVYFIGDKSNYDCFHSNESSAFVWLRNGEVVGITHSTGSITQIYSVCDAFNCAAIELTKSNINIIKNGKY